MLQQQESGECRREAVLAIQTQGAPAGTGGLVLLPKQKPPPGNPLARSPGAQYLVAHPDGGPGTSGVARRHERLRGHRRQVRAELREAARSPHAG